MCLVLFCGSTLSGLIWLGKGTIEPVFVIIFEQVLGWVKVMFENTLIKKAFLEIWSFFWHHSFKSRTHILCHSLNTLLYPLGHKASYFLLHSPKKVTKLVCCGCHNKIAQTRWLKQKFIFFQFWSIEVQDQGVGTFGFSWGLGLKMTTYSLRPHMMFCTCVSKCVQIPSYKDTS